MLQLPAHSTKLNFKTIRCLKYYTIKEKKNYTRNKRQNKRRKSITINLVSCHSPVNFLGSKKMALKKNEEKDERITKKKAIKMFGPQTFLRCSCVSTILCNNVSIYCLSNTEKLVIQQVDKTTI